MSNTRFYAPGNTLSEYGLLIGLLVLLCVGALTGLGGSVSKLLSQPSQGSTRQNVDNLVSLNFGGGSGSGGAGSSSAGGGISTGASGGTLPGDGSASLDGSSGVSTNVTSVEGSGAQVQAVQTTVSTAKAMQAMADSLPDGPLKAWYLASAGQALLLAGNEASLSYAKDNITSLSPLAQTNMTQGDALYEISNYYNLLNMQLASLPAGITESERSAAIASVTTVLDSLTSSYASTLSRYTVVNTANGQSTMGINPANLVADNMTYGQANYTKQASEVAALAPTMLSNGSTTQTPAVTTSLSSGVAMSSSSK